MVRNLAQCAYAIAVGFEGAARLAPSKRAEAMREALVTLREMRSVVVMVGKVHGLILLFTPEGDDANLCENCGKTADAHLGADCKCP
jgi:hypothetical protein